MAAPPHAGDGSAESGRRRLRMMRTVQDRAFVGVPLPLFFRCSASQTKQSSSDVVALNCFVAELVIGPATSGRTR